MRGSRAALVGAGALAAATAWGRTHPSPFPYFGHLILDGPRPFIPRSRMLEALSPVAGEHMLELGPGTGHFTIPVAERLKPGGSLDILDIQPEYLEHTLRRARKHGLDNISPTQGEGSILPYEDAAFDGAFLVTVLGEIPDKDGALRELRRVLKPTGRLVVGEALPDPDIVSFGSLRRRAEAAGFRFERRLGRPWGFFARFRPA